MNDDVIRRLQDAAHAVGETVEAVPPFDPAAAPARRRTPGGAARGRTWLLPVAAAAAVTVAVAGGAAVARHGGGTMDTAAGTTAGPAAQPSFLVQIRSGGMAVRSVADGHVTATVPGPEGERFTQVQATRDNRLFYAVAEQDACRSRFYRFSLSDSGEVGSIGALPFTPPEGTAVTSFAVNGDGSTLAYGLSSCTPGGKGASLVVTDTATGDSRTWTSAHASAVEDVSMSDDGRTLVFRRAGVVWGTSTEAITQPAAPTEASLKPETTPEATSGSPAPLESALPQGDGGVLPEPRVTPAEPGTAPFPVASAEPETGAAPREQPEAASAEPSAPPLPKGWTCLIPARTVEVPAETPASGTAPSSGVPATAVAWECSISHTVWVLDTGTPGGLDDVRAITLGESSAPTTGGIHDVTLTPDGGRVLATVGWSKLARVQGVTKLAGAVAEVVAYDVATGRAVQTLYRDEERRPVFERVDVDGTGRLLLVVGPDETGEVTESGYRRLFTDDGGVARPAAW
ncbi:hypothetical protein [Microbispora sp. KK1-11]|uniref:hypothetical protein n=1 Tax=Microbispora sp. KK1-11 TaxID=2053005 RepID=UPI00115798B0|nr:hypothetical protein [Microbispora sp. KK1-11]TQS23362.1 hypothetical protein FLW16_36635 [Microbispora sp. KK1-11]